MASTKYTYGILADTLNNKVDGAKLQQEIGNNATILIAVDYINTSGDVLDIWMKNSLDAGEQTALTAVVNAHDGVPLVGTATPVELYHGTKTVSLTPDHVQRVSIEATERTRYTVVTPNWCDKTTWFYKATKVVGQTLTNSGDDTNYDSPTSASWVDNYHGKYTQEDYRVTEAGDIPRMKVYVDSVEQTEQDPHVGSGGDYTVNYSTGRVTFLSVQSGSAVITADVWEVGSSEWVLKPEAGKKLKIVAVEVQFSVDISIKDTAKFQPYGFVEDFAPHLTPSPYPAGTLIPLGNPMTYKSMADFINDANGTYPLIPKTIEASPTFRDLTEDVMTYPWNYQATTELKSSCGMEIRISLEHDAVFGGKYATATFYTLTLDEE